MTTAAATPNGTLCRLQLGDGAVECRASDVHSSGIAEPKMATVEQHTGAAEHREYGEDDAEDDRIHTEVRAQPTADAAKQPQPRRCRLTCTDSTSRTVFSGRRGPAGDRRVRGGAGRRLGGAVRVLSGMVAVMPWRCRCQAGWFASVTTLARQSPDSGRYPDLADSGRSPDAVAGSALGNDGAVTRHAIGTRRPLFRDTQHAVVGGVASRGCRLRHLGPASARAAAGYRFGSAFVVLAFAQRLRQ